MSKGLSVRPEISGCDYTPGCGSACVGASGHWIGGRWIGGQWIGGQKINGQWSNG
jgi:hypothetical protein